MCLSPWHMAKAETGKHQYLLRKVMAVWHKVSDFERAAILKFVYIPKDILCLWYPLFRGMVEQGSNNDVTLVELERVFAYFSSKLVNYGRAKTSPLFLSVFTRPRQRYDVSATMLHEPWNLLFYYKHQAPFHVGDDIGMWVGLWSSLFQLTASPTKAICSKSNKN